MRITISYPPKRKPPKAGDKKVIKGVPCVRRQCRTKDGAYLVNNGRPVYEWVPE